MSEQNEATCRTTRAVDAVNAGEALRDDAAALTNDVNEAYYLVHQAVSRALAEPGCAEISADGLSRDMSERFAEDADDAPDTT
jgi:hypothetical protein